MWKDKRELPVATLGAVAKAYNEAASTAPKATQEFRAYLVRAWLKWAGADTPVTELSASLLEKYAASLPSEGRKAVTRHRKVLEVEQLWAWARKRPDLYPGVPEPAQITGDGAGAVNKPLPVVRLAAPDWSDVDKMISRVTAGWKHGDLHVRTALILRYTGLRISQVLTLRWDDLRLEHATPHVVVRAGRRGAKAGRGRVLPLHPRLVELLRSWCPSPGPTPGELVLNGGKEFSGGWCTRYALRRAWQASGVDPAKWNVSKAEKEAGERAHGSPCHSFRAAFKVGLLRAGVSDALVDYLCGHSRGSTAAAYVPEAAPETSPWWSALIEAVAKIPPHGLEREGEGTGDQAHEEPTRELAAK